MKPSGTTHMQKSADIHGFNLQSVVIQYGESTFFPMNFPIVSHSHTGLATIKFAIFMPPKPII